MTDGRLRRLERRAWGVAGFTTLAVLGAIWLTTSGRLPDTLVPKVSDGVLQLTPHLNAALVSLALVSLLIGYRAVRNDDLKTHARAMLTAALLFFGFLGLYLLRLANEGLTEFRGPDDIYGYVYLPVLVVHMVLAGVSVPLVIYNLYVGARADTSEIPHTSHPRVGRVAAPLWGVSFILGAVVYLLLHQLY